MIKSIWQEYHEPRVSNTADIIDKEKFLHLTNKYYLAYLSQGQPQPNVHLASQTQRRPFHAPDSVAGQLLRN